MFAKGVYSRKRKARWNTQLTITDINESNSMQFKLRGDYYNNTTVTEIKALSKEHNETSPNHGGRALKGMYDRRQLALTGTYCHL